MRRPPVDLLTFFAIWADLRRWDVPDVHWRALDWLQKRGDLAVLRCFRGFGKSTILAIYNAWRYYEDPTYRILHQGDQDGTAHKTARDTKAVLLRHPLTAKAFAAIKGEVSFWWVPGADDERNPSMQAAGILSNITSSRADEVQNDDVEVPRNIGSPDAREKLRYRLGEQTHILVPGGRQLYVGTPHTHDSLYDEMQRAGADCLTIRMFANEHRVQLADGVRYAVPFEPEFVFAGIGAPCRVLVRGADWQYSAGVVTFKRAPQSLVDFYAGSAWPERFDAGELIKRRKRCRTLGEWDSQYQLHSKPIEDTRLDPARMVPYDCEPQIHMINGETVMVLGHARIVGASFRWDPSSGKLTSDVSAVAVVLQDDSGRRYVHRVERLLGEIVQFADDGKTITGGQVVGLANLARQFSLPRLTVETNGIGGFSPAVLRGAFRQLGVKCRIAEDTSTMQKGRRILEALEPLLLSQDQVWCHVSVRDGPLPTQMREWNPAVREQPDDYLDVVAGAVTEQPERIQSHAAGAKILAPAAGDDWRPSAGIRAVELDLG